MSPNRHDLQSMLWMPSPDRFHFFMFEGQPIGFYRDAKGENATFWNPHPDTIRLITYFGNKRILDRFIAAAVKHQWQARRRSITIHIPLSQAFGQQQWAILGDRPARPLESVCLPSTTKDAVMCKMQNFFDRETWCREKCIPWKLGLLFHGLPGTGKSSLCFALASHFNLPIYLLNLDLPNFGSSRLAELFQSLPKACIVLLEDLDRANIDSQAVSSASTTTLTWSALLNAIDGVGAAENRILIVTANDPEALPDALRRSGRIDHDVVFGHADMNMITEYVRFVCPDWEDAVVLELAEAFGLQQIVMAEVVNLLFRYRDNPEGALSSLRDSEGD